MLGYGAHALAQVAATADASFTVGDIKIEGLQRISEGTVFNYLPVNIGDTITTVRVREAIRALYATNFFRDVQIRRDGASLVVVVLERPAIESFEITGNKDIKTEDLQKSLKNVGLATGKTFDRSVLEEVQQYLTEQYFSRGKYAVRIDTKVEDVAGNKVKVKIDIKEGKRAKIRQINVVGNESFTEKEIQAGFELHTPNWLSWYKQDDRYSRESLQGDLEKLRSFYMDRGYANFRIDSTQVAIAPEKDDIFITVNVDEGEVYKVSEVKLAGTFVVPEAELRRYVIIGKGETFNRKLITTTQELLQNRLGVDGYAFAKVDPVPTTNDATHEVSLTFFVDPGNRVYVRNITFSGAQGINDEVLRREMRQLEGGWLSNVAVDRSKQRIQRLPYIKKVDSETTPVAGASDLVDVDFKVEEGQSASLGGGIGYSAAQKFSLQGNISDANFLGSGQRVAAEADTGTYAKVYSFSETNPAVTPDGVNRTIDLAYRDVSQLTSVSSDFSTKTWLTGLSYGYPVGERQEVRFGGSWSHVELATASSSSTQLQDWVQTNGRSSKTNFAGFDLTTSTYTAFELNAAYVFDSRDRTLFPTHGALQRFSVSSTIPGSEVEYVTAEYLAQQFITIPLPLIRNIPISASLHASYAQPFGNTTSVPPNRNFYLGGPDSVRGFRESTLGPRDSLGNPYGGDLGISGQFEAIMPIPKKFEQSARLAAFVDFGEAYYLGGTRFTDKAGFPVDTSFNLSELRASTGIAVQWLAPLGLFRFSYGIPLRYKKSTEFDYGDELEGFQFSIGRAF
ncbi:MAG: outer membrane protein assembly factor BamA [Gammaproteobacteria bacterium]